MDISTFGLNAGVIAGIIGITTIINNLTKNNPKFTFIQEHIVLIPILLGFIAGYGVSITGQKFDIGNLIQLGISYAGVSALAYDTYKQYFKKGKDD